MRITLNVDCGMIYKFRQDTSLVPVPVPMKAFIYRAMNKHRMCAEDGGKYTVKYILDKLEECGDDERAWIEFVDLGIKAGKIDEETLRQLRALGYIR